MMRRQLNNNSKKLLTRRARKREKLAIDQYLGPKLVSSMAAQRARVKWAPEEEISDGLSSKQQPGCAKCFAE